MRDPDSHILRRSAIITQQETYEIIRSGKNIKIHRQEITSLSDDKVQLSNGENLKTDAVVLATGYNVIEEVYSPELAAELGVPVQKYEYPAKLKEKWDALETKADAEVIRLFPLLASPPEPNHKPVAHTPYRLYNRALPPSMVEKEDRSLVFVGAVQTYSTAMYVREA